MRCLRCGHCCKSYMVIIVNDPEKGVDPDNFIFHEGGRRCKHLQGKKPGKYSCVLHDYPWYKETPCFKHGQIKQSLNDPCRLGEYILERQGGT